MAEQGWTQQQEPESQTIQDLNEFISVQIRAVTPKSTMSKTMVFETTRAPELSHISFVLATAYLCVCTAKSEGLSDGKLEFSFAADARARLKLPVPSNYFGNCLSGRGIFMETSDLLSENRIFVASEAISKAIKGLEKDPLNGIEHWCSYMVACDEYDQEDNSISIAGSPRFKVYSADFGWGKPRKVEVVSSESPFTISLTDSKSGDGDMEIGLVKEKHEIQKFAAIFVKGLQYL